MHQKEIPDQYDAFCNCICYHVCSSYPGLTVHVLVSQMYRKEAGTGRIYMALSSDSSCHRHLESATRGYERLVLDPADSRPWPLAVRQASCTLPDWAQGIWQHAHVDRHTMVYKDAKNFKTHTTRCVAQHDEEKFVIHSRSQW